MGRLPLHQMLRKVVAQSMIQPSTGMPVNSMGVRRYASAMSKKASSGGSGNYVSPYQEIFDTIKEGKTFLGSSEFSSPEIKMLKCGCPEHLLRFKTTTYGRLLEEPFVKPMEHRVTLQVETQHIPLSDLEVVVLKEIVGNRLDQETGLLQLSSSQFGSRIENKRHVVSMLERVVDSAKTSRVVVRA